MNANLQPPRRPAGTGLNWNRFKSKLLFTYTLSYILIFLVPLSVVTWFIYHNATANLRSEIEQSNVNQLNQVRLSIDNQMTNLLEIAGKIAYDERLTKYMVSHPYYSREAIAALAKYKANNAVLEELFLYYRGEDRIYSNLGMTDTGVTFGERFHFAHWQPEAIEQALNETVFTTVRPAEDVVVNSRRESMLAMLIPIKPNDPYPYGTLLYLIKEAQLTGVMDTILSDFSGSSYIFSGSGEMLTANYRGDALRDQDQAALTALEPGIHSLELGGERYSVVTVQSRVNGWTYATAIPSYQFFGQVGQVRTIIWLVFGFTVLIGIAAAMLLARRQYHPIRDLLDIASLRGDVREPSKGRNEWEWIKQTIRDYHARIDLQEPYVRNQCLLLLFKHGKPGDPEIERMIMQSGLELPWRGACFTLLLSWDGQSRDARTWADMQHLLERLGELELPEQQARIYGVELTGAHQFALMAALLPAGAEGEAWPAAADAARGATLAKDAARRVRDTGDAARHVWDTGDAARHVWDTDDAARRAARVVEALDAQLADLLPQRPNIGVGTVYPDLGGLSQSFLEAASALEQRLLTNSGRIAYFEQQTEQPDAAGPSEQYWIPKRSMLKLEQSLKQGNEGMALQLIAGIMEEIQRKSASVALMRCLCFEVLNTLLRTAAELGVADARHDLSALHAFETMEELERQLGALALRICSGRAHQTETEQPELMDEIVAYVAHSYADYTLSLEHVALKFDISTSYLSRSFKDKTGTNFSQFVWQRRLREVIRQLEQTSAPLKEIIERVGYLDAPNFIRKFKKETGCTPGQYRKLHGGGSLPEGK
ncbi:AraC family transcriptional regulator [Paenibacillus sp. IB182496]|uniref:AraC family transcriptional regulator n=1 Tax=Paenibacillus sabuli TaxID=2772509 RepID=A0A927GTA0_9BACL|nr:helix-turn-helix domain-containing protein [Paenibacillus sabuli]MBD2847126.1 AraC family transcriptional regulator [Paenibacillus sabuli]